MKNVRYFSYFSSNEAVLTSGPICVLEQKIYPCIPQFYYIKWGLRRYIFHGHVILMTNQNKGLHANVALIYTIFAELKYS